MKLTFKLRFHTQFGQSLWLVGNHDVLGNGQAERAIPLRFVDDGFWQTTITLPGKTGPNVEIAYNYILREADDSLIQDRANGRVINPAAFTQEEVLMVDSWNDESFFENAFYTEPFQQVLFKANRTEVHRPTPSAVTHTFKVKAPLLSGSQTLCLLGNAAALGNWNTTEPLLLNRTTGGNFLETQVDLRSESLPIAYKYGVYNVEKNAFVRYEDGDNRILYDAAAPGKHTIVNDGFVVLPADTWKGAGVAIPVFSLRSENSFGIGEFADLKPLADWCRQAGLKLIQLLPINDTTATHTRMDSYPYAAISAFALHPIYLNLNRLASGRNRSRLKQLEPERRRLNALATVDYEAVLKIKLEFIRRIFPSQKAKTFASQDYRHFFSQNQHWLMPYAAFCHLRDQYGTSDFNRWPEFQTCDPEAIAELASEHSPAHDGIALHCFIQYHLHLQLKDAAEYAHNLGVILKGDIAIGVHRLGSDVWHEPEQFHANVQAGAPPDAFAVKGQNWGLPTYNWPRMKADDFVWWRQRFEQMSRYFDAFRIDHILGFLRIWSIPTHAVEGIMGYFVPAIPLEVDELPAGDSAFDRARFTRPFITDAVLAEIFGPDTRMVYREFLDTDSGGIYALKPEFATQRQVESHFAAREPSERDQKIKTGLFDLISNVILFEAPGSDGRQFHFRFGMEQTTSFKYLPPPTQAQLRDLYVDYFFRRQDDFWKREALQKLPALKRATNMLICGEDLGFVPACVPEVMKRLGLLSLEIQRMPKELNREFSRPQDAPYLSVVTPSSHDMSTLRGWWEEDTKLTQKFYNQELGRSGTAPSHGEPWIVQAIIRQHLASPAMWSIFQLQDLLGTDEKLRRADPHAERINVPANPRHYWCYRMHLTLETLLQANAFNHELRRLVETNGR